MVSQFKPSCILLTWLHFSFRTSLWYPNLYVSSNRCNFMGQARRVHLLSLYRNSIIIICRGSRNHFNKSCSFEEIDSVANTVTSFSNGGTWAESFWKMWIEERTLYIKARTKSLLQHETVGLPTWLLSSVTLCLYVYLVSTLKVKL